MKQNIYRVGHAQTPPEHGEKSIASGFSLRKWLRIPPEYRRPIFETFSYGDTIVPPPAELEVWTYTVPNMRRAYLRGALIHIQRVTAAVAAGQVKARIFYKAFGHSEIPLLHASTLNNTVGNQDSDRQQTEMLFFPGDVVRAVVADSSNGGTMEYTVVARIMEFDE